jgi:hypothetical protein
VEWQAMMVVRGGLGIVLGATILLRSAVGVGDLVMLFGMYALLDGMAAAAWATRVSHRLAESWPVLLEGIFSAGLGVFALVKPFQAAPFAHVVALWALVTGALEREVTKEDHDAEYEHVDADGRHQVLGQSVGQAEDEHRDKDGPHSTGRQGPARPGDATRGIRPY